MAARKLVRQTGDSAVCLLCDRPYCQLHKAKEEDGVCEINHQTYYAKHPGESGIFPSLERRREQLGEDGERRGKPAEDSKAAGGGSRDSSLGV